MTEVFELEATVCDALNFNFLVLHTHDSMHILRMKCMEVCSEFLNILSMFQFLKECLGIDDEILGEHLGLILSVCNDAEKDAVQMHERPEFVASTIEPFTTGSYFSIHRHSWRLLTL